jgi:Tol biopolymer transport system component
MSYDAREESARTGPASPELVRTELLRIVGGPAFEDADRLRRFLTYVVEETLAGRGPRLKESVVGVEVFGRDPAYDPKIDPIVRVQARRLRAKLDLFYQSDGHSAGIRIALPKGGYQPEFLPADAQPQAPVAPAAAVSASRTSKLIRTVGAAALLLLLAGVGTLLSIHDARTPETAERMFTAYAGYQTTPAFSPDGQTLAFAWGGPQNDNIDIYVQRLNEYSPRRITTAAAAETRPVWLPDGEHIGFVREDGPDRLAVVVVPVLGTGEKTVTHILAGASDPPRIDWSRDGKKLYTSERLEPVGPQAVVEIDLASDARRALTHPPAGRPGDDEVALSPDGKWIAFRRRTEAAVHDAFIVPVEGGTPRAITHDGSGIIGLAWMRNSRALLVSSRRSSSLQRLWLFPIGGGQPACLTDAALAASYPAVNPRDGQIAYASRFLDANIWRVDLQGKSPDRRLIASNLLESCARYSPDGRRIAFRSNRTGSDEVWVADADGGSPARLTDFGGPVTGSARWSPDGQSLVFDARPYGNADLFLIPAGGGQMRRLTREASNEVLPSFTADGNSIWFASDRTGRWEIWKQPMAGGTAQQVTRTGGFAPLESPDGQWLYYTKMDAPGLFRMPATGGDERRIVESLVPAQWGAWGFAPDGIVYLDAPHGRPNIVTYDPLTGKKRNVAAVTFPPVLWDGSLGVSPDGRYALVSEVERAGSEIHLRAGP